MQSPTYQKLHTRVSHVWGDRGFNSTKCWGLSLHLEEPAYLITVSPGPGKLLSPIGSCFYTPMPNITLVGYVPVVCQQTIFINNIIFVLLHWHAHLYTSVT